MSQNAKKLLLLAGDSTVFYASLWLGLSLRRFEFIGGNVWDNHVSAFTIVLIIWIIVFYINDLYITTRSSKNSERINTIIVSMVINTVIAAVFFYVTAAYWSIRPQTILVITAAIFTILLYLWRFLVDYFYGSTAFHSNVLIVGFNPISEELIRHIATHNQLGYSVRAIIDESSKTIAETPVYGVEKNILRNVLKTHDIQTIVISLYMYENSVITSSLYETLRPNIRIVNLPKFYEEVTGKIPVNQIGQAWVLENFTHESKKLFDMVKRTIDILMAVLLGALTVLLLPFIAVTIVIDSGLPVFFKQTRVGYMGKNFLAIKFRTMNQDAELNGPQWADKNDARVTRVGRLLRKTRLDELPQFINVLRGEMSMIGSRPERPVFVEELTKKIPYYKERLLVRPGLSGWAQVMGPSYGGSLEESLEKLQYDLYYLKNRSLGLDMAIALKTIKTILSRKGR